MSVYRGGVRLLLKVVTDNTKTLESVLNEIKSIPGVSKTQTSIVLSSPKNEYSVPIKAKKKSKICAKARNYKIRAKAEN